jgi:hypothetical protein
MRKSIFLLLLMTVGLFSQGQTIYHGHDASGNRVSRAISMKSALAGETGKEKQVFTDRLQGIDIRIYPNPGKGRLMVEINNMPDEAAGCITVVDLSGKLVYSLSRVKEKNLVDISSAANGIYILKIEAGDNISRWRIVKE